MSSVAPRSLTATVDPLLLRRKLRGMIRAQERDIEWLGWLVTTTLIDRHKQQVTQQLVEHRKALDELRAALIEAGGEE
jgi:hypothetical protein